MAPHKSFYYYTSWPCLLCVAPIINDGCLDIVEYDNLLVDEDYEFVGGEYDYEDANEDGEFD